MEPDADLAAIGRLIGDPNRARLLQVLMGGVPQSGSAFAEATGMSRSLASAHLKKLTAGGLVRAENRGPQQLYSLAFAKVGIDVESVPSRTRPLLRPCLDWTERRHHLAGGLGAAVTTEFTRRGWVLREDGSRIVTVTPAGYAGLDAWLGIDFRRLKANAAA